MVSSTSTSSVTMQNTPEDTQSSLNAEKVASGSRQSRSTPTKSRIASDRRESVDGEIQHGGISFETFLKRAFSVSDDEMEKLKRTVAGYNVHDTEQYKAQEALFKTRASNLEREMYDPYAAMGNLVLNRAMQDAPKGSLPAIQVLPYDQSIRGVYAERKLDVLLVPKEDGGIPITKTNFCWRHALCVMEFEENCESLPVIGKRRRDAEESPEIASANDPKKTKISTSRTAAERQPSEERNDAATISSTSTIDLPSHPAPAASNSTFRLTNGNVTGNATALDSEDTSDDQQSIEDVSPAPIPFVTAEELLSCSAGGSDTLLSDVSSESSVNSVSTTDSTFETVPSPEIQLANNLAEVMSQLGERTHVFGAIVKGTKMKLQFFSRSCGVVSDEIDIIQDPVLHAVFLILVSRQDFKGLGFNTAMGHVNPFNTNDGTTLRSDLGWTRIENGGDNFKLDPSTFRSQLKKRIHTEYCLVGRGTAVYEVEKPVDSNVELVMKTSYQKKTRRREEDAILRAREVDPRHAPEIYGTLTVTDDTPTQVLISGCSRRAQCEERELRIILMRKYTPVSKVKTETEFLIVIFNILIFSHKLFSKKDLLHRDIGIKNIAFYVETDSDGNDNVVGVLIDFDLATFPLCDGDYGPTSTHRSGTKPFMAIETLDDDSGQPYAHHFVHELESILYTTVWYGVGYRDAHYSEKKKELDYLATWRKGTWEEVRDAKQTFINKPKEILSYLSEGELRKFCTELAAVLAERYNAFDVRERWEMRTQRPNPGLSGLPLSALGMRATAPVPPQPEPPIPSKALLPKLLGALGIEREPWICLRDCCQEVPASA